MSVNSSDAALSLIWCSTTTFIIGSLPNIIKNTAMITASLTAFLMLCSPLGNTLYIVVYSKYRRLKTVSNLLLFNVSVVGLLLACISQPLYVVRSFMEIHGIRYCILWESQHLTLLYFSLVYWLIILLISVDRFLATFFPLRYATIVTKTRVTFCVVLCWLFSIIITSTIFLGPYIYYAIICPVYILILTLVFAIYLHILRKARSQRRKIENQFTTRGGQDVSITCEELSCNEERLNNQSNKNNRSGTNNNNNNNKEDRSKSNRKAEKTVLYVVILMMIIAFPGMVFIILVLVNGYDLTLGYVCGYWTETLMFLGTSLSPFVYCWRSKETRKAMTFCCKK